MSDMLRKIEALDERMDRIKVAMDATGSSMERLIAIGACADIIECAKCPIMEKCDDLMYMDCIDVWCKYLMGEI